MFGYKSRKLTAAQKDVLQRARENKLLTEDEVMIYIAAFQEMNPERSLKGVRPYSVIWFDSIRKRSVIVHTSAEDSVEAVSNIIEQIPPCVNCTAVVGHIPTTIRFVPDKPFET